MNPGDLRFLKGARYDNGSPGLDLATDCQWLLMVVPPEELSYLQARRDDNIVEPSQNWRAKESPF
jgi:hypothetical protein